MTAYTIEQYKNAARKAKAAGNLKAAEELAQAGIALQNQGQQPEQEKDRSFLGAVRYGLDAPLENLAETADALGYKKTGDFLSNLTEAPENYDPASAAFINEGGSGFNFKELPRAAVEQAGQFAGSIASRAGGAAVGAAITGGNPLGAIVGGVAAPALFEGLQQLGGIANERARNNGREVPNREDWIGAITGASGTGILNAIAPNLGGFLKRAVVEGGTEAIQSIIQQVSETAATDKGLEVSPKQAVGEGIIGSGSVAAVDAPVGTVRKVKSLFTSDGNLISEGDLSNLPESEKFAAADVARLIDETSKANGYKLKNVDPSSSQGAKQALEDVRSSNVQAINDLRKVLKKQLDPKNAQSLEQLLSVYSEASAGIGAGKKKVSQKVTEKQIQAIQQLVGNTKEGRQLVQELVKSNVITNLFKDGMKGGISQFTDLFNPISHSGAVYDPTRYANVFVGGASAYGTGGLSLGIAAGGRVVDFFTGRRSKVSNFVKKNRKALGLPAPEGTSVIEQKAKQKADAKDRRAAIAQIATILDAPKAGFVENILLGTGLDRSGLETVLNDMAGKFGSNSDFVAVLDDIQKNLDGEGVAYLDNLSEIIPVIGAYAQAYSPELVTNTPDNPLLKRSFDSPNVQTDMPTMGGGGSQFGAQFAPQENYRRGIQDNLDFVRTLQEGAGKDKKVSRVDRGRLITSLENLTNNLGSNPVETVQTEVQKLQDQGVNQDAIDKYVQPYVDRVVRQQRPKPRLSMEPPEDNQPSVDSNVANLESARELKSLSKTRDTLLSNIEERKAEMNKLIKELDDAGVYGKYQKGVTVLGRLGNGEQMPFTIEALHLRQIDPNNPLTKRMEERLGYKSNIIEKDGKFYVASLGISSPDGTKSTVDLDAVKAQNYPVMGNLKAADPPVRLNEQSPALQQPEIPRGETTNIQMPNTLGSAFEFAKNSNFRTGRDFKLALQEKALKAQQEEGIDLSEFTEENVNRLADYVVADALDALQNNSNAIGWYDRTVSQALETLGEVYPEIQTNPVNKLQFIWALAVTSNGTKVDKNFELAATAYDTLQRTGRFPAKIGIGDSAKQIDLGLAQYHTMLEKFDNDHGRLEDFMTSQSTVRELENTYKVKIPDESKDTEVRGAAILGAKIGNGFFSNLYGYFDALTMDRWLMRTVGRHRGTLIKINEPMIKKKHGEIKSIFTNSDKDTLKSLRAYLKPSGIRLGKSMTRQDMNDLAFYIAKQSTKKPWREGLNEISNDLRKSANGLAGYLDGQVEQPAGGGERNFIRSIFRQALDRVNADPAVSRVSNSGLTMSDLQALLWYPEKRLYDSSKAPEGQESRGYTDDEAPDYANAARKFVETRKEMAIGSRLGSSGAAGDGRRGATSPNARLSQQPTGSAGILFRNASQSAASRRPRSDDRNIVPNTSEVKQAAKPVKALIAIGSPNGEFPDGIKDIEGVRRLAEATNITINMYLDQDKLIKDMGFDPTKVRALGAYGDGVANVLKEGSTRKNQYGETLGSVDSFEEYITTLHEVFHGVNDQLYNPEFLAKMEPETRAKFEGSIIQAVDMGKNKVTGRKEIVTKGSFDSFIAGLTTGKTKVPNNIRKKMLAEMLDLQKNGYFRYNPATFTSQRGSVRNIRDKRAMETNPDYKKYVRNAPETAVDVIMYYAHDPKRMKREYPNLAKMVKGFFSQSSKVQFFSHPLAMAIAVVYAMLLKQEQAEEEELQQGILAQRAMQAGALTA